MSHRLRVFKNNVLRTKGTGSNMRKSCWKNFTLQSSSDIIGMVKSRLKYKVHGVCMAELGNAYKILFENREISIQLEEEH
jgi:hypothetical protein